MGTTTYQSYLIFWTGQIGSLLGSSIVKFAIIVWITTITKNAIYLSISTFIAFLPQVLIIPFAGVLIDRWNKKKTLAVFDFLQASTTLMLIFCFSLGVNNVWFVIFINGFRSIFQAFHLPAYYAIMPIMIPKEKISRINGLNFLSNSIVNIIGPSIGIFLLSILNIELVLLIDVITFLIAFLMILNLKIPKTDNSKIKEHSSSSFWSDFGEGLKTMRFIPGLVALLVLATIVNFFEMPLHTLISYFVKITHDGNNQDLAIVIFFMNLGFFIGASIVSLKKEWRNKIKTIIIGMIIGDIGYFLISVATHHNIVILSFGILIYGIFFSLVSSLYTAIIQIAVPSEDQGKVMSLAISLASLVSPISILLSGPIVEIANINILFAVCALICIFINIIAYFFSNIQLLEKAETLSFDFNIDASSKPLIEEVN